MPISRPALEIHIVDAAGIGGEQAVEAARELEALQSQSLEGAKKIAPPREEVRANSNFQPSANAEPHADAQTDEEPSRIHVQPPPNLPPAVAPSAGTPDASGPTQPETKAHRSVAPGRDAPSALAAAAQEDGGADIEDFHAQTALVEHRLTRQQSASVEHLSRVHQVVGRILELGEAHLFDSGEKLESLDRRLAELEMRFATNRLSQ